MTRDKILIVDDMEVNREILAEILHKDYDLIQAKDGIEAVEQVKKNTNDLSLILLDIMMPGMDGYEVLETLRANGYTNKIPVIIITASGGSENEVRGLETGAADFITKPFFPKSVLCRVEAQIELRKHRLHLEKLVNANVQKVIAVRDATVDFLASVIEHRHVESGQHVKRTRLMAEVLLKKIVESKKMDSEIFADNSPSIAKAVALHDVGKIGIPDNILLKPGPLTKEEFEIIKTHPVIGARIVKDMSGIEDPDYLRACHNICLYHHERWDGKGYPEGRAGKDIPFAARLMAVIDVYDALTSPRVYKPAMTHKEALDLIVKGAGTQFDPVIVEIFAANAAEFEKISAN